MYFINQYYSWIQLNDGQVVRVIMIYTKNVLKFNGRKVILKWSKHFCRIENKKKIPAEVMESSLRIKKMLFNIFSNEGLVI